MTDEFLQPGRTFDSYELVEPLGEGAMGVVWRAKHLRLRRQVAIKFMKAEAAASEQARARFLREGEALARVDHEHVVKVHDVGVAHGELPYTVMELLEGEDLRGRLRAAGALPLDELVDLMLPVCAAVAAAHDEGVVHRDLKPANIFLARTRDRALVPKVVDFGISRVDDDDPVRARTLTSAVLGTPRYMSPEQVRGARHVDARSDQYALGVILYEGAVGAPPFADPVLFNLMARIVAGEFAPPRALRPELPEGFDAVVRRAMANRADDRFPDVRSLARALLPFASERARHLHAERFDPAGAPLVVAPPDAPAFEAPSTTHGTTLGEAVRELPAAAAPTAAPRHRLVAAAGFVALSLAAAAVAASWPHAPTRPTAAVPATAVRADAAPTPPPSAPPAPPAAVAQVLAPSPSPDAPAAPPAPRPTSRSSRAAAQRAARRPAPGPAAPPAPVAAAPAGTTAGGAPID